VAQIKAWLNVNDPSMYDVGIINAMGNKEVFANAPSDFFIGLGFWEGKEDNPAELTLDLDMVSTLKL